MMSKFGKGRGGQLLGLAMTVGGTALATHQMSKGIEGVGNQEPEQGFSGGGKVGRLPGFSDEKEIGLNCSYDVGAPYAGVLCWG